MRNNQTQSYTWATEPARCKRENRSETVISYESHEMVAMVVDRGTLRKGREYQDFLAITIPVIEKEENFPLSKLTTMWE